MNVVVDVQLAVADEPTQVKVAVPVVSAELVQAAEMEPPSAGSGRDRITSGVGLVVTVKVEPAETLLVAQEIVWLTPVLPPMSETVLTGEAAPPLVRLIVAPGP